MFKITPIQDAETQKKYAALCGISAREGYFAYAMLDTETLELMGMSQFEISTDVGYISELVPRIGCDDFEAMFILGRQTMNFIDLCGVHKAKASAAETEERLLRAIGFKRQEDGIYFCDMDGMFDGKHCSGHAVDLDKASKNLEEVE